ncbi:Bug family tripartite tricarboxylate transporter substrate binding protein [Granulosicoccus antarcticus]|uniref:Tripartite tricarboxylate transporter family receptor n=1 Tax=Granulosicoccus antarcticus IMCC3135 TaxID=1192854 RepID=A0A2Z2NIX7_9GAMM|nr:tripartite tricarboxylate transporter substrate binding protein [Granulosicoccus antarcticus]ASJ71312.1 hypothetical protein IMCC3135_06000 [Granulosicoccus antarcticus IMCC3135]
MKLLALSVATALCLTAVTVHAQDDYPSKRVDVIIPFDPGGGVDATGRLMAAGFEKHYDANFVVKNISGAGGTIGTSQLARSKPDGYTIGVLPIGTATTQPHRKNLPYGDDSWEEVCLLVKSPLAVLVHPESQYQSIEALMDAARAGKITVAGPPKGSVPHMAQAALAKEFGVEFSFIPFEGGASASKAVLGKEVDFTVETFGSGKQLGLTPLMILAPERVAELPDTRSIKEVNGSELDLGTWFGLFAPKDTPAEVVDSLAEACEATASSPEFVDGIAKVGWNIKYLNKPDFAAFFQKQYQTNGELLNSLGLGK